MKILTFDVEEWFHILDNDSTRTVREWKRYESRIHANMDRLFGVLEEKRVKATFFCLGWIAEQYPEIVKRIDSLGYEVGSHSYAHQLVYEQQAEQFREDLLKSIKILEDLTGKKIRIYRSPGFSFRSENQWAFDILLENGIEIDCSIFPANRSHGGFINFGEALPTLIECETGIIKELPINVCSFLGKKMVFSGGGYFRLLPYPIIRRLTEKTNYLMTYFHPRDFDPEQPVITELGILRRFKSYYGLSTAITKLKKLLDDFNFVDISTADKMINWNSCKKVKINKDRR